MSACHFFSHVMYTFIARLYGFFYLGFNLFLEGFNLLNWRRQRINLLLLIGVTSATAAKGDTGNTQ